jgi:hypothetical protein
MADELPPKKKGHRKGMPPGVHSRKSRRTPGGAFKSKRPASAAALDRFAFFLRKRSY